MQFCKKQSIFVMSKARSPLRSAAAFLLILLTVNLNAEVIFQDSFETSKSLDPANRIAGGADYTCALTTLGAVKCWGG